MLRLFALLSLYLFVPTPCRAAEPIDGEYFEKKIRPILAARCTKCHNANKAQGGLDLSSAVGFRMGGDTGPIVEKASVEKSRLIEVIGYESDQKMPPTGKLSGEEIATLTAWVTGGAPWPADGGDTRAAVKPFDVRSMVANHWAYQPLRPTTPKADTIDQLVRAKLTAEGIAPAPQADKLTLIRRLTFDLTGLPPTPEEIDSFEADTAPDAYPRLVKRLLASPHYGERWARHWLDLVRYAETRGHEFDFPIPEAWRYRDYVVRAFNDDIPWSRFVSEQIAGDLLTPRWHPTERWNEAVIATGFWQLGEGKHSPVDSKQDEADRIDNMIDVFGKTFLGQTIACARCHDHKFDPIPTVDYYALYGMLSSSRYAVSIIDDPTVTDRVLEELARVRPPVAVGSPLGLLANWSTDWYPNGPAFRLTDGYPHSGRESLRLEGSLRSPTMTISKKFLAVRVAGRDARLRVVLNHLDLIQDPIYGGLVKKIEHGAEFRWVLFDLSSWIGQSMYLEVLDEGDGFAAIQDVRHTDDSPANEPSECPMPAANGQAKVVEMRLQKLRRSPGTIEGTGRDEAVFIRGNPKAPGRPAPRRFLEAIRTTQETPSRGSGRRELAAAVTDPANPLAARVFVNRVWQHHFGTGLVPTPDDFGKQGEPPTHPELLDSLTAEFLADGGSLKRLHERILSSETYRMAAYPNPMTSVLARNRDPKNRLLHRMPVRRLDAEAVRDAILLVSERLNREIGGPGILPYLSSHMEGRGRPESGPLDGDGRRSLYLQVRRNFLNPILVAFDFPTPFTTIGRRTTANVPAQALVMMNNPFVRAEAERWADRICKLPAEQRIERLYREAFGRRPTADERTALDPGTSADRTAWVAVAHALLNAKEFVFIE